MNQANGLIDALPRAGRLYHLTPIGVDTDGTTLPGDVGMARLIAKKSWDFIGRRSLLRSGALRDDRPQLVGL